ncbi:MAG: nuclear transport factor 2 family protein [Chloroflexi bacterium CFX7]|nr:MAG: nuclear transport factor 2 family protein [bacterium]MCE7927018.1 nuclear transport factor 2 family protein [Chloroflexi bacterium CFX7]MCK6563292.1 nuclear transport factor 2 family protein [Dehalococcoidia bacterium]MCL4232137.1 nuclear transport factor 2 family protein [Dehalococcoidia bacterium]
MADRIALARQYMEAQAAGKIDEAVALLADDVVMSNPMTGTTTGKAAAEAGMRNRPAGAGAGNITWREPVESDGVVKIVGDGSPFGPIRILVSFNDSDQISKVEAGLGS